MRLQRRQFLAVAPCCIPGSIFPTVPLAAQNIYSTVDVRDFGATGDGITNDSAAVDRAIRSNFKTIRFPAGRYLLSGIGLEAKEVSIDASEATLINAGVGTPIFRVSNGARLVRSRIVVGDYQTGDQGGVFMDIAGGLVASCDIYIERAFIASPVGGIIRHRSGKSEKEGVEGLYFSNISGMRWENRSEAAGPAMIDISSGFNSFSACNFSVRDVRLLSGSLFCRAICSSGNGAAFMQIKLHDISVEKCLGGFAYLEGIQMSGLDNIGMFDLKGGVVTSPLIVFKHTDSHRNAGGCYCRDIFRARARFANGGCDLMYDNEVLEIQNFHAIGGLVTRSL